MASPILWPNEDQTVSLVDIPASIARAQGTIQRPCHDQLLSTEPQQAPFPSNEPKSASARTKLESKSVGLDLHAQYATLLKQAMAEVHRGHSGPWCRSRKSAEGTSRTRKKRKISDSSATHDAPENIDHVSMFRRVVPDGHLTGVARQTVTARMAQMKLHSEVSPSEDGYSHATEQGLLSNATQSSVSLELVVLGEDAPYRYRVPPNSSFMLSDCCDPQSFHHAIRAQAEELDTRKHFDLILLDPPWPNRSVRRTQKSDAAYRILSTPAEVRKLLLEMDLDMLMAEDCLVAIWITNKSTVRELVLGQDGIFACWGFELVEEWIWLKTTIHGEPVTSLDGLWRKPYEVLLVGRKRKHAVPSPSEEINGHKTPKRRVIISVPDLHSRKPCLKGLYESVLFNGTDYRALEVFARHLVAGWWSWGDECIKFNGEGYWSSPAKSDDCWESEWSDMPYTIAPSGYLVKRGVDGEDRSVPPSYHPSRTS